LTAPPMSFCNLPEFPYNTLMKLLLFLCLGSFSVSVLAQTTYVPATKLLLSKGYQIQVLGEYFDTSKIYDRSGNKTSLKSGEKFSFMQGEVGGFYGLTQNFQIGFGGRYRRNQSTYTDGTNTLQDITKSGFESTFLSLKYGFKPVDKLHYALEGLFRYTPYTNTTQDDLILGDDGNDYSAGLAVTYASLSNNYLTVRSGYRKPGKSLSSEIYWQAEAALAWTYFAIIGGVDGTSSLKNDQYTDDPQNKPVLNTRTSALYNSINREWIKPYVGFNLALGADWRIEAKATQVVSGRSTDLGTGYSIMLARRVDGKKTRNPDKQFKSYDVEAAVIKVSPKKNYLVIDKGLGSEVRKGMKFDFFEFDYMGGNILVATGSVISVKVDSSIVKITQTYNVKRELKEGLVARAALK
jgi:hypothetical protein